MRMHTYGKHRHQCAFNFKHICRNKAHAILPIPIIHCTTMAMHSRIVAKLTGTVDCSTLSTHSRIFQKFDCFSSLYNNKKINKSHQCCANIFTRMHIRHILYHAYIYIYIYIYIYPSNDVQHPYSAVAELDIQLHLHCLNFNAFLGFAHSQHDKKYQLPILLVNAWCNQS